MKIICLSCGHKVDLGDAYDDYAGPVKCVACGMLLKIKTEEGNLRSVACARESTGATSAGQGVRRRSHASQGALQE